MVLCQEYYKSQILSLKRGVSRLGVSNAKPHFLLAVLSRIDAGAIMGNMVKYPDDELIKAYQQSWQKYEPGKIPTPIYKPYFHLSSDSFYHVKWKGESRHDALTTPSVNFQRENIDYTYFDSDLWDFLQDHSNREFVAKAIVSYFFKS